MQWLNELPCHTWFRSREVPGPATTVDPLLSRLTNQAEIQLHRISPGLYFKGHPKDEEYGWVPNDTVSALLYAGVGAGLRKFDALNNLRWSSQMSAKIDVTTLRRVKPYKPYIRYTKHSNKCRADLNWSEVTILEALHFVDFVEQSWVKCLETIGDGSAAKRVPWRHQQSFDLRRDKLLYAAEQEQGNLVTLKYRINEVCDAAVSAVAS